MFDREPISLALLDEGDRTVTVDGVRTLLRVGFGQVAAFVDHTRPVRVIDCRRGATVEHQITDVGAMARLVTFISSIGRLERARLWETEEVGMSEGVPAAMEAAASNVAKGLERLFQPVGPDDVFSAPIERDGMIVVTAFAVERAGGFGFGGGDGVPSNRVQVVEEAGRRGHERTPGGRRQDRRRRCLRGTDLR
ncbi:MAG: hypothetical protein IH941_07610 [Acidobacteria bacterium]|nr:hypothetical protein [Acidobacteriota bacterium]